MVNPTAGGGAPPRTPVFVKRQAGNPVGYIEAIEAAIAAGALIWPEPIGLQISGGRIPGPILADGSETVHGYWIDSETGPYYVRFIGTMHTVRGSTFDEAYAWAIAHPDKTLTSGGIDRWPGRLRLTTPRIGPGTLPGRLQWYASTDEDLARGDDSGTIELAGADWGQATVNGNGKIKPWQIAALLGAALLAARM